ncbi:hypothetical protein LOAG_15750 [Loa loa]|uniref:Uncharacterized protein n=1 Tax=Loa loa TaxID=7209 RepID=A0A1S0TF10_LOALO|nr:hypothetical protein LOAG_15750 [Loa loa]EFO12783.1 hypothetical protein LOAG_15750 [Loa loa]
MSLLRHLIVSSCLFPETRGDISYLCLSDLAYCHARPIVNGNFQTDIYKRNKNKNRTTIYRYLRNAPTSIQILVEQMQPRGTNMDNQRRAAQAHTVNRTVDTPSRTNW